ncbi:MAG: cation diffusion facilitator family transporter [Alphaproteobacteria bacterium]|nr:cation diffusion facilitator family transporter [Alphaproteobacteria bacterium]
MTATPESESARLMRVATWASVATASFLIVIKLVAWGATGSMAVLSTLIDSVLDAAASVVNLLAVRHALQPADREHRFGHGKAEPLAGLGQAAFIAGSGLFLVIEATQRIAHPEPIERGWLGIGVMIVSIILTMLLVRFQRQVVARTDSVAIGADSLHYAGDVLINLSVIVSLGLAMTLGWHFADPIFAVAIAAYLVWNAWAIAQDSLNLLMDREFSDEDRKRIEAVCLAHPKVRSIHDLRTRSSGQQRFIQLHLELDAEISLRDAHDISDEVERDIREAFPHAEVIIHEDPAGLREGHREFE